MILYLSFESKLRKSSFSRSGKKTLSFVSVFVICLLISDLIQSISGITQVKWASENKIYEGRACSIQGVFILMCTCMSYLA